MADVSIFSNPAFGTMNLSDSITCVPNMYDRITRMGLFSEKSIRTTHFSVEYREGNLNLIPAGVRGGPAHKNRTSKRSLRTFQVPHFSLEDEVLADDIQNIRAWGSVSELQGVQMYVNDRLAELAPKHQQTMEWMRMGALNGNILDADGSTLLDLYGEFGITRQSFNYDFAGAPNIEKTNSDIKRYMRKQAKGEPMSGIYVLASPGFMDNLLADASVKEAYRYYQAISDQGAAKDPNREADRDAFKHQGLIYHEYDGEVDYVAQDGTVTTYDFIPNGEAIAFPLGTRNIFRTYVAPADFMETVNTPGQMMYAKQEPLKFNRGIELHTQMNAIPFITRPELVVTLTSA